MRFEIVLSPGAVGDLRNLRTVDRSAVKSAIEEHLRNEPGKISKSRIKRLRGMKRPQYRLRVGDLRVFYDVRSSVVEVLAIISKSGAAEWLQEEGDFE